MTKDGLRTRTDNCRCWWPGTDDLYVAYHDREWGVPEFDDRALFEKLILDGFQAGLSWITILRKRENFRRAFAGFDPAVIARFDAARGRGADARRRHRPQPRQDRGHRSPARAPGSRSRSAAASRVPLGFRRRSPDPERPRDPRRRPLRERDLARASRRRSRRKASTSSARPSSTPSCRRSAWSTTTSSVASAMER